MFPIFDICFCIIRCLVCIIVLLTMFSLDGFFSYVMLFRHFRDLSFMYLGIIVLLMLISSGSLVFYIFSLLFFHLLNCLHLLISFIFMVSFLPISLLSLFFSSISFKSLFIYHLFKTMLYNLN